MSWPVRSAAIPRTPAVRQFTAPQIHSLLTKQTSLQPKTGSMRSPLSPASQYRESQSSYARKK